MAERGTRAGRALASVTVGMLAMGALGTAPAVAGKFLTKKAGDKRYVNVGEKASDSDRLDGQDATAFATAGHNHDGQYAAVAHTHSGPTGSHTHSGSDITSPVAAASNADTVDSANASDLRTLGAVAGSTNISSLTDSYEGAPNPVLSASIDLPARSGAWLFQGQAAVSLFTGVGAPADNTASCKMQLVRGGSTTEMSVEVVNYEAGANRDFPIPVVGGAGSGSGVANTATVNVLCKEATGSNVEFFRGNLTVQAIPISA